jgi:hypothetical protein
MMMMMMMVEVGKLTEGINKPVMILQSMGPLRSDLLTVEKAEKEEGGLVTLWESNVIESRVENMGWILAKSSKGSHDSVCYWFV